MTLPPYQIEPARCKKKLTVDEVLKDGKFNPDWVFEQKRDDLRYLLQIRPRGINRVFLTSRRISKITGKYVEKQDWAVNYRDFDFPAALNDTVLDGGFYDPLNPRCFASDVVHCMKEGKASFHCFDVLKWAGKDVTSMPWRKRKQLLSVYLYEIMQGTPLADMIHIAESTRCDRIFPKVLNGWLKDGLEGAVLKNPDAAYGVDWVKVKRKSTYDVFIIGFAEPTSEIYAAKGWFGALLIAQVFTHENGDVISTLELGQVKNMTDELRAKISKNRKAYLNRVVEIDAETRLTSGKFRNPSVKQLRDDRTAESCIFRPEDEA